MQPVHEENLEWKGDVYQGRLYTCKNREVINSLSPITQVQAVCFTDQETAILYKDTKGTYGLPGGTLEQGESLLVALKREVNEEAGAHVVTAKPFGYVEVRPESDPGSVFYQVRYVAHVTYSEQNQVQDPDGKAIERVEVEPDKLPRYLDWGEKGDILLKMAQKAWNDLSS